MKGQQVQGRSSLKQLLLADAMHVNDPGKNLP